MDLIFDLENFLTQFDVEYYEDLVGDQMLYSMFLLEVFGM